MFSICILILYYSRYGSTEQMAKYISFGVTSVYNAKFKIRTVPNIEDINSKNRIIKDNNNIYVTKKDLETCDGIIIGSPTRFGNMAAPMKYFIDSTSDIWLSGALINKPAGVFTSTSSKHGGQETTLLSMMIPLLHHGAIIIGLPYNISELHTTKTGGTPYGPSHYDGHGINKKIISLDEKIFCKALGARIANIAIKMKSK